MSGKVVLIDSDIISYQVGFSSQTVYYMFDGRAYGTMSEVREAGGTDDTIKRMVDPMPVRAALKMTNELIHSIIEDCNSDNIECYLTGKGNFREQVATVTKYKGTRKAPRPYHYQAIRDHLTSKYGAVTVDGIEADDKIVIRQNELKGEGIIASRDKDLRQMYGWHYSWAAGDNQPVKPLYEISYEEGMRNYFQQMLEGDVVDNILGVISVGKKKAEKALSGCTTVEEMMKVVLEEYYRVYGPLAGTGGYVHYTSWDGKRMWKTPAEIMDEMHQLLWMLRHEPSS